MPGKAKKIVVTGGSGRLGVYTIRELIAVGYEVLSLDVVAKEQKVYIATAAFEQDPEWPEIWFTTGFIIGPSGDVELRYRKIHEHNVEGLSH